MKTAAFCLLLVSDERVTQGILKMILVFLYFLTGHCFYFHFTRKQSSSAADGIQSEDSDYSPQRKKTKKDFFKSILTATVSAESNEVDLFLADQSTKLSSLNKYPTIKAIFIKYNAAFPSSASVERLFSVAGRIFTPLRGRLSDKNFERMLLLKVNKCIHS